MMRGVGKADQHVASWNVPKLLLYGFLKLMRVSFCV